MCDLIDFGPLQVRKWLFLLVPTCLWLSDENFYDPASVVFAHLPLINHTAQVPTPARGVLKPCISGTNEKKCLRKVRKSSVTSTPAFSTRNAFLFFCDVLALGTRRHASSARTAILRFRAMLRPKVPHPLRKSLIADRQIQHSTRHFAAPLPFYAASGGAA